MFVKKKGFSTPPEAHPSRQMDNRVTPVSEPLFSKKPENVPMLPQAKLTF